MTAAATEKRESVVQQCHSFPPCPLRAPAGHPAPNRGSGAAGHGLS
ncbi:hypothetical protein [Pseudorhodobacter sp. MZDSW-24AT]|nr:hypothetical protein [Pseudorhodobacter sp. MZDSW-24AT]